MPVDPSSEAVVAAELLGRLLGHAASPNDLEWPRSPVDAQLLDRLADQLWQQRGRSLVVSGANDVATQIVVNAINALLGSYETTVDLRVPSLQKQGDDDALAPVIEEMRHGDIGAVIVYGVNPAYDYADAVGFVTALKNVPLVVAMTDRPDETTEYADIVCPDHHYLEAWADAEPVQGCYSLGQPTIRPLFDTRAAQDSLLKWIGATPDFPSYLRQFWRSEIFSRQRRVGSFDAFWNQALHDGVTEIEPPPAHSTPLPVAQATRADTLRPAIRAIETRQQAARTALGGGRYEVVVHETIALRDGRHANNPWLQELPDPITSLTWGNCAAIAPSVAAALGVANGDVIDRDGRGARRRAGLHPARPGARLRGACARLWTHARRQGRPRCGGQRVSLRPIGRRPPRVPRAERDADEDRPPRAAGPHAAASSARRAADRAGDLAGVAARATGGRRARRGVAALVVGRIESEHHEHLWGMSIDLTACGCSACVVACQAENNVPVVGGTKSSGRAKCTGCGSIAVADPGPPASRQPMMPALQPRAVRNGLSGPGDVHSSEGLNQQVYNAASFATARTTAVQVRRFNWFQ